MSKHALEQFLTKLQQDAGLRGELKEQLGAPEDGIPMEQVAAFAAGKGYEFSADEVEGELSDAELDAVAGGENISLNFFPKVELSGADLRGIRSADGSVRLFYKL